MRMWKFSLEGLLDQIEINYKEQYVEWHPSNLTDRVWDVLNVAMQVIRQVEENSFLGYHGSIIQIEEDTFRFCYEDRKLKRAIEEL
jgi:hypothetical protein